MIAAILGATLWTKWQEDNAPQKINTVTHSSQISQSSVPSAYVPEAPTNTTALSTPTPSNNAPATFASHAQAGKTVNVKTDLLNVEISLNGGDIVSTNLLKYPVSTEQPKTAVSIFNPSQDKLYISQSGLTGSNEVIRYQTNQKNFQLGSNRQDQVIVVLNGTTRRGLHIEKTYTFTRGSYAIVQQTKVINRSGKTWRGGIYNQLVRLNTKQSSSFHTRTYYGGAISTEEKPYEQLSYKNLDKSNVSQNIKNGWVAMQQPYFLSAWVPNNKQVNHYYSQSVGSGSDGAGNLFTLGYVTPEITLKSGSEIKNQSTLYVGPELKEQLVAVAPHLDLTINYGFLSPISVLLFWVMTHIYNVIGNWGWTIILVTIFIKAAFYPLSAKSLKSMARMRELQPKFAALRERLGDDKQAMGKATMEIYKKEKVNPMGGCLPMIIQIPVFFALYYVLIESVQFRQAPFMFWVHDLSVKDPFYILPILMGASMFIQQKMNPPPPDPTQAKVMMFLPVIFTVFFLSFPAGLVLYWLTNNCVQSLHQWYVIKTFDPKKEKYKERKKKKK